MKRKDRLQTARSQAAADGSPKQTLRRILPILRRAYGRRRPNRGAKGRPDIVSMLVDTILSQNTNNANSTAGFEGLRRELPTWDAVADARTSRIERCIRVSGLARTKAPRIRAILREIRRRRGRIELDYLDAMSDEEVFAELTAFRGVGPKTALCTMLFAMGRNVFPVDTHIFRIARRLGVMPEAVPFARAHEHLTPLIAPRDRYAMHVLLIAHGRAVCKAGRPRCDECRILAWCSFGQERMGDWLEAGGE
jgi:endonuclease-3